MFYAVFTKIYKNNFGELCEHKVVTRKTSGKGGYPGCGTIPAVGQA